MERIGIRICPKKKKQRLKEYQKNYYKTKKSKEALNNNFLFFALHKK